MSNVSFRSINFTDRLIRHQNFLAELTPIVSDLDKNDSTFTIVPGLADSRLVSFQSVNFPDRFLRHQNFRLKLDPKPGATGDPFFADATFAVEPGLSDAKAFSFRSMNFQDRFIRHRDFHLFIEPENTPNLKPDATFDIDTATFDRGSLTSGLPLGGSAHLVARKNGDFTFSCHAHDSGFDNIDYVVSAVLMTPSGIAFTFQHSGNVEGTVAGLPVGTPKRDDDFIVGGNNPVIANEFGGIPIAKLEASIDGRDTLVEGLEGVVRDLLKKVLDQFGMAAANAVVALV
jgi:hypothetical protein